MCELATIDSYIRNIYVSPHIHPKDTTIPSVGGDWYGRGGAHISSAHIRALHLFVNIYIYVYVCVCVCVYMCV